MFTKPKTRDNLHPENWPDLAVVSHNDEWQHLMKQRTYIITSLMRQLTAGGGKGSRINSMDGGMDEKGREGRPLQSCQTPLAARSLSVCLIFELLLNTETTEWNLNDDLFSFCF